MSDDSSGASTSLDQEAPRRRTGWSVDTLSLTCLGEMLFLACGAAGLLATWSQGRNTETLALMLVSGLLVLLVIAAGRRKQ